MTEPNIVRTRRQRIEARNPGSWSGPLAKRYSKYTNMLHCDALDLYRLCYDLSIMHYDRCYMI